MEAQRCKIFFTGEGRNGKTSTRKALTYASFDPAEQSTRGTTVDDFGLVTNRDDGLVIDRHEARNWKPHSAKRSDEHARGLARLVVDVLRKKVSVDDLLAQGVDQGLLLLLRAKLAEQDQGEYRQSEQSRNAVALRRSTRAPQKLKTDSNATAAADVKAKASAEAAAKAAKANAEADAAAAAAAELELAAAMALVEELKEKESETTVQMWDFGGQKLFMSLHHLFLTTEGVYVVVFNPQELLPDHWPVGTQLIGTPTRHVDKNTKATCIEHLRLWCNAIYLFAPNSPGQHYRNRRRTEQPATDPTPDTRRHPFPC